MKAKRILLVLVCAFATVLSVACGHKHAFDAYEISVAPTEDATGKATASCECGETSEVELPALSDSTVWSVKATVNPTCTEKGSKTYTSIYGEVVIEISTTEHTYTTYVITTDPTETVKGTATAECSCGNIVTVEVPVLTDSAWTVKSTTDATCNEDGSKVYTSIYGEVTVVLTATNHNWGEWTVITAPTKTEKGLMIKGCVDDATHIERFELPTLNDENYTLTVEEAKCGVEGKEVYSYVKDGQTLKFEIKLDALKHNYGEWTVTTKPTATEAGKLTKVCTHDATHTETFTIPALNKTDYTYAKEDAKCGVAGKETYTFTKDGQALVIEVVLTALTHAYGEWTVTNDPTTTAAGLLTRVCSHDVTHTDTYELPALNKTDYACVSDKPECGEAGKETYTYTKDGQTFEFEVVLNALTHTYGEWSVTNKPTATEAGLLTRVCTYDTTHVDTFNLPALNKVDYTYSVEAPICGVSDGLETYTYTKDGQTFEFTVVVPKTDHLHDEYTITTEPSETETGLANAKCDCGDEEEVTVPVLTDTTVWVVESTTDSTCTEEGNKVYTSVYGKVTVALELAEHEFVEFTITTDPTESKTGLAMGKCECTHEEEVVVPALNNETVWELVETVEPDYNKAGRKTYTSVYGEVTVAVAKLVAPYDGKTYTSLNFEAAVDGVFKNAEVKVEDTWSSHTITIDENGKGFGSAYPFRGYFVIEMVNAETGEILVTKYDIADPDGDGEYDAIDPEGAVVSKKGYVDFATGIIICEAENYAEYNLWKPNTTKVLAAETINGSFTSFTYITNNSTYPNPSFYKDGGLKMNFENMGVLTTTFEAQNSVNVTLTINALNGNTKTGSSNDVFTVYGLNSAGEVVATTVLQTVVVGDNTVTLEGEGIVQVKVIMTAYPHNGTQYCNVSLGGLKVTASATSDEAIASCWDNALAISYTDPNADVHNVFVYNGVAYFGVEFTNGTDEIPANECFAADLVYVKDSKGNVIEGFAHNGTKLVVTDGFEGTYTDGENTLVIGGAGLATMNSYEATYVIAPEGSDYTLGGYSMGGYYEVTLDKTNMTFTMVQPMVTVILVANENETDTEEVNKNIAFELPILENTETHTFKGWFYDADCTLPVEAEFVPTSDITVYASWKAKVVVTLVGVAEGDASVLYLGEGDVIGDYLPVYTEIIDNREFDGWYLDETYENTLPEDAAITPEDTGIVIYAKWIEIPAYVGVYKGTELYNAGFGNYGGKSLTINENGEISGVKTGVIISYNPETQVIEWKKTLTDTTVYRFFYNETLDIIAGLYNNNDISNDFYIFSKVDEDGKANAYYGIKTAKSPTDSSRSWYAHLVNITTALGDVEIFLYNNYIYDTFTATDSFGNPLTADTVKDSKTLIVKDADGNVIVSVASEGASFSAQSNTIDLDPYFGTYTNGVEEVVLDGVGNIVYGELTGTYTVAEDGASYGFDVYFENNTSYYELTLDGDSFTLVKVMVNVTFEEGEYAVIEDAEANKNIPYELPVLTHDTNVFNGWYYDAEFTQPVGTSFVPTTDVTLYALWKVKVTLTLNSNNGTDPQVLEYSEGDEAVIPFPEYAGFAFAGWYTTETFEEGTEWGPEFDITSGEVRQVITANTTIYAKYTEAAIYSGRYVSVEIGGTSTNGAVNSVYARNATITFDPYGNAPKGSSWPFASGDCVVKNYNSETGYLEIHVATSSVYKGFIDPITKFIVLSDTNGSTTLNEVMVMNPYDEKNSNSLWSGSYWNSGKTRLVTYTTTGFTMFISDDNVYFGVTVENAEGEAIASSDAYNTDTVLIKDGEGNLIAKYGHDGTTLQKMDGSEGTYTNGTQTLVLNGVKTAVLDGVTGTYAAAEEGSTYGYDVYVDGIYYEVSINKEESTFTINKPMVTITFDAGEQAVVEAVNTNKNVEITLPIPSNDEYVFRGWYLEETYETLVESPHLPVNDLTLYAKWDAKVTLTVVYGNGLENVVLEYGANDEVSPVEPSITNGKVFNGWFTDKECTTPYAVGTITENITIYCGWKESIALFGAYKGFEVWGSNSKGGTTSGGSSSKTLNVDASGNVTGEHTGTISDYNAETGTFKFNRGTSYYWGFFDAENGVLAYAYSSNKETLGNDVYIYIRDVENAVTGSSAASYWNSGLSRLMTVTLTGHEKETVNLFLNNDVIYFDVSFEATGVENLGAQDAYKQNDLRVYAANGDLIAEFMMKDGVLVVKALDGYQGTYTVEGEELVLDGYGAGTLNGAAITYNVSGTIFTITGEGVSKVLSYDAATNTFNKLELDAFANKKLSATHECPNYSWSDTHTVSFTFDGKGNVTISCICTDMSYCGASTSFSGAATYVIDGSTMTITKGSETITFTIDGMTLTIQSTTITSSDSAYLPVGTIVK